MIVKESFVCWKSIRLMQCASNHENEEKRAYIENEVKHIVSINNHESELTYPRDAYDVGSLSVDA